MAMTPEEIRAIGTAAAEQVGLADKVAACRRSAESARTCTLDRPRVTLDYYHSTYFAVEDDPATVEAIRALLIAHYTRKADEAEAKLK